MNLSSDAVLSRMLCQQRAVEMIANNVANANTVGFKGENPRPSAWSLFVGQGDRPPLEPIVDLVDGTAGFRDGAPGSLQATGNPLDLAIQGAGYFEVLTPAGVRLTRNGHFTLTAAGDVADGSGNPLLGTGGRPLQVGPGAASITVTADGAVTAGSVPVGKIGLAVPTNPAEMTAEGNSLFNAPALTQAPDPGRLVQGALEQSNVQPVVELTRLMSALREFQLAANYQQAESDRMQKAIDQIDKDT